MTLAELLKYQREKEDLLMREMAYKVDVDTAIISKIENGYRVPTKEQLKKYATALHIDYDKLLTLWISEKLYQEVKEEPKALDALKIVVKRIKRGKEE